jgi:hypothetical protein
MLLAIPAAAVMSSCGVQPTPTPTRTPRTEAAHTTAPSNQPQQSLAPTPTPSPTPTPDWPLSVFLPDTLPRDALAALESGVYQEPQLFTPASSADEADIRLVYGLGNPGWTNAMQWAYAVVAPFPTLTDDVDWDDVANGWRGEPGGPLAGLPLYVDSETGTTLSAWLGPAGAGVTLVPTGELVDEVWASRPSWAIVPFDRLEPRLKVLRVDGDSPLQRGLMWDIVDPYPLVIRAHWEGDMGGISEINSRMLGPPITNRDESRMTVVMMTGVTALARGTASAMEREGMTYPARDIIDWLLEPDVTHISNEVSFARDCGPPARSGAMSFCSSMKYFNLLRYVDVDVVELTGNHLVDWGESAMLNTLKMYRDWIIPSFGGGADLANALQPITLTVGVHTFAFAGCNCNPFGPQVQWATDDSPGAAPCDIGQVGEQLGTQVRQLADDGYLPIVTMQHVEEYSYEPTEDQRADFRALAEYGAVIVSGSQAHQPQAFEFHSGAFIHYGLGNLFFDQMQSLGTRQEFLDRHIFYDGRHISTELLTAMLEDYARPRPMTPDERESLLAAVFAASGW